jgi:predicted nucleic acid-binding protein
MHKYMFDTNIFNDLCDGRADLIPFIGKAKFLATHIQLDEIKKTSDEKRQASLYRLFEEITSNSLVTESFIHGISRLDNAKLGGEDNLCEPIRLRLDELKKRSSNIQDALIAETAIKNGLTFVTHDSILFRVTTEFGGACANIHQVIKDLAISD